MDFAPTWIGAIDVSLARVLVVMASLLTSTARDRVDDVAKLSGYRVYHLLLQLPIFLLFFIVNAKIR